MCSCLFCLRWNPVCAINYKTNRVDTLKILFINQYFLLHLNCCKHYVSYVCNASEEQACPKRKDNTVLFLIRDHMCLCVQINSNGNVEIGLCLDVGLEHPVARNFLFRRLTCDLKSYF
jgi:hypothetical protein